MANENNEAVKFVLLIEEHLDVLSKSQTKEQKQKKSEAAGKIIEEWKKLTSTTLTHGSLLKKINNLKSRAKTALSSGKPLGGWQTKILEICGAELESDADKEKEIFGTTSTNVTMQNGEETGLPPKSEAEQILEKYETDETTLLTNDQLQRLVLLKQIKVLSLQEQRLEQLSGQVVADKDVVIDFVGWEGQNMM